MMAFTVSLGGEVGEERRARPGKTGSPHPTPQDPEIRTALVSSGGMVGAPRRGGPFHIALTTSAPPAPFLPLHSSLSLSLCLHLSSCRFFLRHLLLILSVPPPRVCFWRRPCPSSASRQCCSVAWRWPVFAPPFCLCFLITLCSSQPTVLRGDLCLHFRHVRAPSRLSTPLNAHALIHPYALLLGIHASLPLSDVISVSGARQVSLQVF
ncbi:hypothetical protein E2C01_057837 [Portunus trituberculatus]|uniref:Uncharacterized protein n=1 Tax=Portunus trituberculatus TaxID=210409 RepID=A0A5B7H1K4_PORTR|nr:hypothetical protein [Portunus trituberculatus]